MGYLCFLMIFMGFFSPDGKSNTFIVENVEKEKNKQKNNNVLIKNHPEITTNIFISKSSSLFPM